MSEKKPRTYPGFTPEQAKLGGIRTSEDREHMSEIGKKGGSAVLAKYGPEYFREMSRKRVSKKAKQQQGESK